MEMNVLGRKKNLLAKMPELKKALQTVKFLLEQQQVTSCVFAFVVCDD